MPVLKRLCPGCRRTLIASPATRCADCAKAADRARGSRQQRGYGPEHQRWRAAVLARDPWCVACLARGVYTESTVADHIVALRRGGGFDLENGQGLCSRCHGVKSVRQDGGLGRPREDQTWATVGPRRGAIRRGAAKLADRPAQGPPREKAGEDLGENQVTR
jgi:5-methylcytosine-specific restriction protein A